MVTNIILIVIAVLTVALAALFAGAETGMYQFSRLRLRLGIEKKRMPFVLLGKALHDGPALLTSILIGTNLTHYLTTSIVTWLMLNAVHSTHNAELFAALITTPILFIFAEVIPKNIFFYRADTLMPYTAPLLLVFHKLLTWSQIVPLLKLISRLFAAIAGAKVPTQMVVSSVKQHQFKAVLKDTHEEAFLSSVQTDIINRLAHISNVTVRSVMIPLGKVQMLELHSDNAALLKKLRKTLFTRLPVYDGQTTNIVGFVNIYDALSSQKPFTDLQSFLKPIPHLAANTPISDAIDTTKKESWKIILVTKPNYRGREKPIGIITMKDLAEELLGELAEW